MRQLHRIVAAAVLLLLASWLAGQAVAQVNPQQRRELTEIRTELRRAENLYRQSRPDEAAETVRGAHERIARLAGEDNPRLRQQLEPIVSGVNRLHALLALEGIPLGEFDPFRAPAPETDVLFTEQVAPILVAKCGRCHVANAQGGFSMADYETLMRGTDAGAVVLAGDADGSRIIEVIESGDMPRGGLSVADEELDTLRAWIAGGAAFDGDDPRLGLRLLAPDARPDEAPMVEVTAATGEETVLFARDLAPALTNECLACHGGGQQPSAQLNLATFRGLLRGGESGPPLRPGQPADSLLVQKLKGTAGGRRMPQGRPPLSDELIGQFETWIAEGARFDGHDADWNVADVAAVDWARRATHEQLSERRAAMAMEQWQLAMPGVPANQAATDHFLVVGSLAPQTLDEYASAAEAALARVAPTLRARSNEPWIKGRMTIFLFQRRYDYSEFGKMVEQRELPRSWQGHWRNRRVDAYAAVLVADGDPQSLTPLLARLITSTRVADSPDVPDWFADATGRAVAARAFAASPMARAWDRRLAPALSAMQQPDDFLADRLLPDEAEIVAYGFVRFLMSDARRFQRLLDGLRAGQAFEPLFAAAYGGAPQDVAAAWARSGFRL